MFNEERKRMEVGQVMYWHYYNCGFEVHALCYRVKEDLFSVCYSSEDEEWEVDFNKAHIDGDDIGINHYEILDTTHQTTIQQCICIGPPSRYCPVCGVK